MRGLCTSGLYSTTNVQLFHGLFRPFYQACIWEYNSPAPAYILFQPEHVTSHTTWIFGSENNVLSYLFFITFGCACFPLTFIFCHLIFFLVLMPRIFVDRFGCIYHLTDPHSKILCSFHMRALNSIAQLGQVREKGLKFLKSITCRGYISLDWLLG